MADEKEQGSAAPGQDGEPRRYRDIPPEVQEILTAHQKWVESREGQPAQLARHDLNHLNLAGVNLRDADLQNANFLDANLQGANFQGANFQGTDLTRAVLRDAGSLRYLDNRLPARRRPYRLNY